MTRSVPLFCEPVGFEALTLRQCRFPVSKEAPFLFCGADRVSPILPYCAGHVAIAYTAARPLDPKDARR